MEKKEEASLTRKSRLQSKTIYYSNNNSDAMLTEETK